MYYVTSGVQSYKQKIFCSLRLQHFLVLHSQNGGADPVSNLLQIRGESSKYDDDDDDDNWNSSQRSSNQCQTAFE